jgi:dihydroflavonol-4-reductase
VNGPVLVTGGSGFVGGAVVRRLVADGTEVRALARSDDAERSVASLGATPVPGDVDDEVSLARAAEGCDVVFHAAGVNALCRRDPIPIYRTNVLGTERMVRAAARAGSRRIVLTSSAATIGEPRGAIGREDSPHRGSFLSHYERSKWLAERRGFAAATDVGVEMVAVNPASVQGPGRTTGTARLLIAAMNRPPPVVVDATVSLVDVDDCAWGHVLAAERGEDGQRYLLCGVSLRMPELLGMIRRLAGGSSGRALRIPPAIVPFAGGIGDLAASVLRRNLSLCSELARTLRHGHRYDGSRACRKLGLEYTPIAETLRRTFAWYVEQGLVRRPPGGHIR